MSLVHNERTKLTANWLDRASTTSVTLGVIAPLAAVIFGYPSSPVSAGNLLIGIVFWFLTAMGLHFLARLAEKASTMTQIEFLAFVGSPLLLLGIGVAVYLVTGWLDGRDGQNRGAPAE
jgi:multisubunit Na+/H+ antiporter MnhG subunit